MVKVQFNDVVPPEKRSIRNIPISNSGKRKTPIILNTQPKVADETRPTPGPIENLESDISETKKTFKEETKSSAYEFYYPKELPGKKNGFLKNNRRNFIFGSIVVLLVLIFFGFMMTVFSSATITVIPKSKNVDVALTVLASKATTSSDYVRFEILKMSKSGTESVPATGQEFVELKASGKIVIYNNFSTEPQRLITRTRFETPEGLIFRIPESVIVPGKKIVNGVSTPGSIEVEVFADEPGEKYNIDNKDFKIPGFKNDPARYKDFYARSVTPMSGGFVGNRKTVVESDRKAAFDKINSELRITLEKDLKTKIPEDLVFLKEAVIFENKELSETESSSNVVIGSEVTAYAILLNKEDLSRLIAKNYLNGLADWTGLQPFIKDFSNLKISTKPSKIDNLTDFNLKIDGQTSVFAQVNKDVLIGSLVGINRSQVPKIISQNPAILSLKVTLRPIWKRSFPTDLNKIDLKIEYE